MSKARAIPHAFHKYLEVRETFTGIDWGDERLREPFIKFIDTFFRSTCVRPSRGEHANRYNTMKTQSIAKSRLTVCWTKGFY